MTYSKHLFSQMNFDWYQATIATDVNNILECLSEHSEWVFWEDCKGIPQYDRALKVIDGCDVLAVISYDGNAGAPPNVRTTGHSASKVAHMLRARFPLHRVTRVDVAVDFASEGLFEVFHAFMDKIHFDMGVARKDYGFASPENGRTFYLGSAKSPMQVRLYEKGKKHIGEGSKGVDPNWIRLEAQYRPRSAEKAKYATIDAEGVWGASRWSRYLIGCILDVHPEPIKQVRPMERTAEDKARWVAQQYQKMFLELGEDAVHKILCEEVFNKWKADADLKRSSTPDTHAVYIQ